MGLSRPVMGLLYLLHNNIHSKCQDFKYFYNEATGCKEGQKSRSVMHPLDIFVAKNTEVHKIYLVRHWTNYWNTREAGYNM